MVRNLERQFDYGDEYDVSVDPVGSVGVTARALFTVEDDNGILEVTQGGSWQEQSRVDTDKPMEIWGPGVTTVDYTPLDE